MMFSSVFLDTVSSQVILLVTMWNVLSLVVTWDQDMVHCAPVTRTLNTVTAVVTCVTGGCRVRVAGDPGEQSPPWPC